LPSPLYPHDFFAISTSSREFLAIPLQPHELLRVLWRCGVVDEQVEKSRTFRREGADIHSDVAVSLSQAILGGTVRVPGITDHILLNVSIIFTLLLLIPVRLCSRMDTVLDDGRTGVQILAQPSVWSTGVLASAG